MTAESKLPSRAWLAVVLLCVTGWMPSYLGEHFQLAQGRAGLLSTGLVNGAMLFGLLVGGAWADRWSRTHARGRIYVPMVGLCVAAPAVAIVSLTGALRLALSGLAAYGVARAFADGYMMPILCLIADPHDRLHRAQSLRLRHRRRDDLRAQTMGAGTLKLIGGMASFASVGTRRAESRIVIFVARHARGGRDIFLSERCTLAFLRYPTTLARHAPFFGSVPIPTPPRANAAPRPLRGAARSSP